MYLYLCVLGSIAIHLTEYTHTHTRAHARAYTHTHMHTHAHKTKFEKISTNENILNEKVH